MDQAFQMPEWKNFRVKEGGEIGSEKGKYRTLQELGSSFQGMVGEL